jgi:DNA primase
MGKISIASAKYIVHASIEIKGAVDKPDVIGAIFGQTEGLLGSDLELRELQRSGRIGRIEVTVETKSGITRGKIIIPSSLDKSETSIVGAALEIIQRIGPCESKLRVEKIEDVRISKREFVVDRAKQLLKHLSEDVLPDSQELAAQVSSSVRVMEIQEYGRERLPAGPGIADAEEVLVVEGRADVLNLLKHGIKNAISMNGTSVPQTIRDLSKKKVLTAFVDGDRGGDLILKELASVADLDFLIKAPTGKEVEELTKKEIFNALRHKIEASKAKIDLKAEGKPAPKPAQKSNGAPKKVAPKMVSKKPLPKSTTSGAVTAEEKGKYKTMLEDLIGTRAAVVLDTSLKIIGKVPVSEVSATVNNVAGVHAVIIDGDVGQDLVDVADKKSISCLVGMGKTFKSGKVKVLTVDDF